MQWWLTLPAGVGVGMGLLYALSGFRDGGKTTEFKRNPRVTNLLWVATGGIAAVLGDWEKLAGAPISKVEMAGVYIAATFLTAIVTIGVIAISIYRDRSAQLRETGRAGRRSEIQIALLYVHSGYPAYEDALKAEREQMEAIVRSAQVRQVQLRSCADLAAAISAQIAASSAIGDAAPPKFRDSTINTLLSEMISVVIQQTALSKDEVAINFMEALPFATAIDRYAAVTRFIFDAHGRYQSLLILKRYLGRGGGEDFGLPVHAPGRHARPLPGAPSVMFSGNARYIQTDKIATDYAKGLKTAEIREIVNYLEAQGICCCLSLPIQWGGRRLGVVNIDSKRHRFGLENDPANHFANTLLPFCMLLGNVIQGAQSAVVR